MAEKANKEAEQVDSSEENSGGEVEADKEKTAEKAADLKRKIQAEEIAGASESAVHALYEELKALNASLGIKKEESPAKPKRRWLPF